MAVRAFSGFDCQQTVVTQLDVAALGTVTFSTSVTRGSWSRSSGRANPTTTGTGSFNLFGRTTAGIGANGTLNAAAVFIRVYVRIDTLPASADEELIQVCDTSQVYKFALRVNSAGRLAAYDATPTLIATGTAVLSTGTWYRIELRVGTDAGAVVEWKVDGTTDVSTTATLSSVNNSVVKFGKATDRNGNSVDYYFEDSLVDDASYPGPGKGSLLIPTGAGTYQTATVGAGSGANWQILGTIPPDMAFTTNYLVTDGVASDAETELMQDSSAFGVSGTIHGVMPLTCTRRDGASNGSAKLRLRSGSTDTDGAAATTSTVVTTLAIPYTTDPATGAAWTPSGIDGCEVGVVENSANKTRFSCAFLLVDFDDTLAGGGASRLDMGLGLRL